jgi:pimeloyl-ACP methyl ester carboxylesterase
MAPSATKIHQLPSGTVAVAEFGAPDGEPAFFFHGWPSSRTQAILADQAAREVGVRLIAPDRPGIGRSSFQAGRRLLDWPPVLAQLADALELNSFRILAVSGGGPYALASAWALPERVTAAAVVCGAPPLDALDGAGLIGVYRWLLALHRRQPKVVHQLFRVARPFCRTTLPPWVRPWMLKALPAADAATLQDTEVFDVCHTNFREASEGSAEGVIADAEIYAAPWGFPLEEVRVPIQLWHGKADRNFSWELAEALSRRLPNCTTKFVDAEGHYSLPIRRVREILDDLLSVDPGQARPGTHNGAGASL